MGLDTIAMLHPRLHPESRMLVLELDHGKANEIGSEALGAFEALCEWVESDASILSICTTSRRCSAKGKALFIAGADVRERVGWSPERTSQHLARQRAIMMRVRHLPVFCVALSAGATLGWGVEFCLSCDYVLATPTSSFALPETGLGIVPGAGGTALLAERVGLAQALRLGCTGESIDDQEALRIGLVDELVPDVDSGIERVRSWAERLKERSPSAVAAFKHAVHAGMGRPVEERIACETRAYEHTVSIGDAARGRESFVLGSKPQWGPRRLLECSKDQGSENERT